MSAASLIYLPAACLAALRARIFGTSASETVAATRRKGSSVIHCEKSASLVSSQIYPGTWAEPRSRWMLVLIALGISYFLVPLGETDISSKSLVFFYLRYLLPPGSNASSIEDPHALNFYASSKLEETSLYTLVPTAPSLNLAQKKISTQGVPPLGSSLYNSTGPRGTRTSCIQHRHSGRPLS